MAIVSTEKNRVVKERAIKLGIQCHHGTNEKLETIREIAAKEGIDLQSTAYIGNDVNDLSCMEQVGLPVAVADAHPLVKQASSVVLKRRGGHGAVREFCAMVCAAIEGESKI